MWTTIVRVGFCNTTITTPAPIQKCLIHCVVMAHSTHTTIVVEKMTTTTVTAIHVKVVAFTTVLARMIQRVLILHAVSLLSRRIEISIIVSQQLKARIIFRTI